MHIQTNGLSVGVVTSSTSSEKRRRERDELVTSNSGSVKHRREKSDKDTMSKRILEPTDPVSCACHFRDPFSLRHWW